MKYITRGLIAFVAAMALSAPDALAQSHKRIVNRTSFTVNVVLIIRAGEDPKEVAGTKDFRIPPNTSRVVQYGDPHNIYLNGVRLSAVHDGESIGCHVIVTTRGSHVDHMLNQLNTLDIVSVRGVNLEIEARESGLL